MHENKFEKQVREKMDELGFIPSDAVWAGVDKEINKDKKRRRPIFWLVFLFGLFLAGGAYYFGSDHNAPGMLNNFPRQKTPDTMQNRLSFPADKKIIGENTQHETSETTVATNGSKRTRRNTEIAASQQLERKTPQQSLTARMHDDAGIENNRQVTESNEKKEAVGSSFDSASANIITGIAVSKTAIKDSITGNAENKTVNKDSIPGNAAAATKKDKKNAQTWKVGFSGGAGFSNTSQSLFQSAYPANAPAYGGSNSGNPGTGNVNYAGYPDIKAGFSFDIGVFANRHFSKLISLSAGIGYHYFSTKMNTGVFVDSSINVSSRYMQLSSVNTFYRNGWDQSYTNQYHFIELPVSANFQLNKSENVPVIWEAGFSLSYLISSNALHYDPLTNIYFQNNQLLNRMQFSLATAVLVGFRMHHNEWQIGPQLQYGLTSLLQTGSGENWHLFYGGLKISLIPGKK